MYDHHDADTYVDVCFRGSGAEVLEACERLNGWMIGMRSGPARLAPNSRSQILVWLLDLHIGQGST